MQNTTDADTIEAHALAQRSFFDVVRGFSDAILVTHTSDHRMHARPMHIARIDDDGDLWFVTGLDTAKIDEIARAPGALVTMQAPHRFASLNGTAKVVHDRATVAQLWSESFRAYWNGPSDPTLALIHFFADSAEYWDDSGLAGIRWAFRATAAALRGSSIKGDDDDVALHGVVKL